MLRASRIGSIVASVSLASSIGLQPLPARAAGAALQDASPEAQVARAKQLYMEGAELQERGNYALAAEKYREAYALTPDRHIFNYNIGMALYEARDCPNAQRYLQDFLVKVPENADLGQEVRKVLRDIEASGCAVAPPPVVSQPARGPAVAATDEENPLEAAAPAAADDEDAPALESRRSQRKRAAAAEKQRIDREARTTMFKGGLALVVLGGAFVITGAACWGLAFRNAGRLQDQSSPSTTGYPKGSYADDKTYTLDQQRRVLNIVTPIALSTGALLLAGGLAMLILDRKRHKRGVQPGLAPAWIPGGAAAALGLRF